MSLESNCGTARVDMSDPEPDNFEGCEEECTKSPGECGGFSFKGPQPTFSDGAWSAVTAPGQCVPSKPLVTAPQCGTSGADCESGCRCRYSASGCDPYTCDSYGSQKDCDESAECEWYSGSGSCCDGLVCNTEGVGVGKCQYPGAVGSSCNSGADCASGICDTDINANGRKTCSDCLTQNTRCSTTDQCCGGGEPGGLICDTRGVNACVPPLANGQPCWTDGECQSNICDTSGINECVSCQGEGGHCEGDNYCCSGMVCQKSGINQCISPQPDGSHCYNGDECSSGYCDTRGINECSGCLPQGAGCSTGGNDNCCSGLVCNTDGLNSCQPPAGNGAHCYHDYECASGYCDTAGVNACSSCLTDGERCQTSSNCCGNNDPDSGSYQICYTGGINQCQAPNPDGGSCRDDYQCTSGYCDTRGINSCSGCIQQGGGCDSSSDCCGNSDDPPQLVCNTVGINSCQPPGGYGARCEATDQCQAGLTCDTSGLNTCQGCLSQGSGCGHNNGEVCCDGLQCNPDNTCQPKVEYGEPCTVWWMCDSEVCVGQVEYPEYGITEDVTSTAENGYTLTTGTCYGSASPSPPPGDVYADLCQPNASYADYIFYKRLRAGGAVACGSTGSNNGAPLVPSWQSCYSIDTSLPYTLLSYMPCTSDDCCSCTGTGNEISCSTTGVRYCASGQDCYAPTGNSYAYGEWSSLCAAPQAAPPAPSPLTQQECYSACVAGGYATCAWQFDGCYGGEGTPSARSGCTSSTYQFATVVGPSWKSCYSVSEPLTPLGSGLTQQACFSACVAGGFATCAWQYNGCYGSAGPPSPRSGCTTSSFQYATPVTSGPDPPGPHCETEAFSLEGLAARDLLKGCTCHACGEKTVPWTLEVDAGMATSEDSSVTLIVSDSSLSAPQSPAACYDQCSAWMPTYWQGNSAYDSTPPACVFSPACSGSPASCSLLSSGSQVLTYTSAPSSASCVSRGVEMNQPLAPTSGSCAAPSSTCDQSTPTWSDYSSGCYFSGLPNMPEQDMCDCSRQQLTWQSVKHGLVRYEEGAAYQKVESSLEGNWTLVEYQTSTGQTKFAAAPSSSVSDWSGNTSAVEVLPVAQFDVGQDAAEEAASVVATDAATALKLAVIAANAPPQTFAQAGLQSIKQRCWSAMTLAPSAALGAWTATLTSKAIKGLAKCSAKNPTDAEKKANSCDFGATMLHDLLDSAIIGQLRRCLYSPVRFLESEVPGAGKYLIRTTNLQRYLAQGAWAAGSGQWGVFPATKDLASALCAVAVGGNGGEWTDWIQSNASLLGVTGPDGSTVNWNNQLHNVDTPFCAALITPFIGMLVGAAMFKDGGWASTNKFVCNGLALSDRMTCKRYLHKGGGCEGWNLLNPLCKSDWISKDMVKSGIGCTDAPSDDAPNEECMKRCYKKIPDETARSNKCRELEKAKCFEKGHGDGHGIPGPCDSDYSNAALKESGCNCGVDDTDEKCEDDPGDNSGDNDGKNDGNDDSHSNDADNGSNTGNEHPEQREVESCRDQEQMNGLLEERLSIVAENGDHDLPVSECERRQRRRLDGEVCRRVDEEAEEEVEEDLEDETEELVDLELNSLDDALTDSVSQLLDGTGEIEFEMAQEVIGVEMETVVDVTDEAVADAMASAEAAASEAAADVAAEVTADVAIDASIAEVGADVGLEVALDACIAICWM